MATRIDGKAVSAKVREEVAKEVAALKEQGLCPAMAVVIVGDDPASRIYVNNKEREVPERACVNDLAASLQLPEQGVAVAVDNRMVPRTEWERTELKAEARVVIIKAACGG